MGKDSSVIVVSESASALCDRKKKKEMYRGKKAEVESENITLCFGKKEQRPGKKKETHLPKGGGNTPMQTSREKI